VPMPWTAHEPHCGFSTTQAELYLPQPDGWSDYAATHQWENVHSFLRLYAELLRLRRTSGVFGTAEHAQVSHEGDVLTVHLRGAAGRTGRCVLNMGEPSVTVADAGRLQALSDFDAWAFDGQLFLPGGSAAWMADLG